MFSGRDWASMRFSLAGLEDLTVEGRRGNEEDEVRDEVRNEEGFFVFSLAGSLSSSSSFFLLLKKRLSRMKEGR